MARHSAEVRCSERRTQPRYTGALVRATLKIQGRWGKHSVEVIDFNRHGMSIIYDRPLEAPKGLRVCLQLDELELDGLRAVIHNCRATQVNGATTYRLGVQFRTCAADQFDCAEVERTLVAMEQIAIEC